MSETQSKPLTYKNDFAEYLTRLRAGKIVEIDEEMYFYWLGVLPPTGANREENGESMRMTGMGGQWVRKDGTLQRFSFAFAEGYEYITVFWLKEGKQPRDQRYFAQKTAILNRRG